MLKIDELLASHLASAIAQAALRRARENEIHDPGLAAAIMKAALRTIAGEKRKDEE